MTTIRIAVATAALALLATTGTQALKADLPKTRASADWRPLFDGRSLEGWEHVGPGKFVVEDGVLRTEGGMGLLWYTREKLGNCVLRVVYKTANDRSNSGVYIRIAEPPKEPWFAVHHGFEVQIMDSSTNGRGTGSIYTFAKAAGKPTKAGEWNTLEVMLKGKQIATTINGEKVAEFDSSGLEPEKTPSEGEGDPGRGPRPESGYIGLQNHDERSIVYFKEVSVRPLPSTSN